MATTRLLDAVRYNVTRLREARGWTKQELAEKSGVHRVYISKLEGTSYKFPQGPTLLQLERLAQALDVDVQELMT